MHRRHLFVAAGSALAMLLSGAALAQTQGSALTGLVSSAEENAMEGVLVSATKEGSTVTFTVVTGKDGRFAFPASKLDPGRRW